MPDVPKRPGARTAALAEVKIGYLEEAGTMAEYEMCLYKDEGRRNCCHPIEVQAMRGRLLEGDPSSGQAVGL